MSKSLGNGIDPLEVIDQYGADALRMTLVVGSTAGNDMRYSEEKITASRNFANKLWNAARFVLMNLPESFEPRYAGRIKPGYERQVGALGAWLSCAGRSRPTWISMSLALQPTRSKSSSGKSTATGTSKSANLA